MIQPVGVNETCIAVFLHFAKKLINFRPSYRHDFGVFCVGKVERDPPIEPYMVHYEMGGTKNG